MEKKYDVILVGAGPAGIFCAYELITKNKNLKVLLVEKGNDIYSKLRDDLWFWWLWSLFGWKV